MRHLGTLTGEGRLLKAGEELGYVTYEIHVTSTQTAKSGQGRIEGDFVVLSDAFESNKVTLELQSGESVEILVTSMGVRGDAEIRTSGPVPGF